MSKEGMVMYRVPLAVALLALTFGFAITAYAQAGEKPPLSAMRITGEALAGGVGELAVYLIGESVEPQIGQGSVLAWLISTPVACATGVYLVGNMRDETGSFLATLAGGILGWIAGIAGDAFLWESGHRLSATIVLAASSPIGAIIGFNLTRKYESSANSDSQMHKAAPSIRLNLLRLRF